MNPSPISHHASLITIGITGQSGFIGTHLYNTLGLHSGEFDRVLFEDGFFENEEQLKAFVKQCNTIVHLAAMNRHGDPQVIYDTNLDLVKKLIAACEATNSTPHIIFSSSTQEECDNLYGKSKQEGRKLFEEWASRNNARFTGLIIPNVFGPFGHPYYNSVVATFCHQLTHNEQPKIEIDGELKLVYVNELIDHIIKLIIHQAFPITHHASRITHYPSRIPHTATIKVSDLLNKLAGFKETYLVKGIIPNLEDSFDRNLFNTLLCYVDHATFFPFHLKLHTDDRGSFVETVKAHSGGQISFSTTKPGVTRGNHFHTRKAERFAVIKGKARIELRRIGTDRIIAFQLDGNQPSYVDMPIWHTHNITNIGKEELYTIFWISEHFDAGDADTFFEEVGSVMRNA